MDMQNKWFLHDAKLSKYSPNGVRQQRIILSTKNHKDSTKLCAQNACHMILRLSVSRNRQMGKNNKSIIIIWGERHSVPSKTSHKYWIQFCIMFDSDRLSCWQNTKIWATSMWSDSMGNLSENWKINGLFAFRN